MEKLIRSFYLSMVVLCILLFFSTCINKCLAGSYPILELDELKVQYIDYFKGGRDPLISLPNRQLGKQLNLSFNSTLFDYFYWNSLIHSSTDEIPDTSSGQFRVVGLEMQLGVRITNYFNLYLHHHSQHSLDTTLPFGFPVQDGVGLEIIIFSNKRKEGIF